MRRKIYYDLRMNAEEKGFWIQSLKITGVILLFIAGYLVLRRGYFNLYIANKVMGSTSAILAATTLAAGPLGKLISIRKQMGLTALFLGLVHTIISIAFLPQKFPFPSWFLNEWIPITFGLIAIGVWTYIFHISHDDKIHSMGFPLWKKHQSIGGQIAFLFVFLHLTVMKYPGWIRWVEGKIIQSPELANPHFPPASLLVFTAMAFVILIRTIHFFRRST